jgi:hypothetical protein
MSSAVGFTRPGLRCEKCGEPFSLFLGTGQDRVEKLPDPFEAKCPCGHVATYPKSAIYTLEARGGQ